MHIYPDNVREQIVTKYDELLEEQEIVRKLRYEANMKFRNAAYTLVSSNYTKDDNVAEKIKICEDLNLRYDKIKQFSDALRIQIHSFNRYQKYENKIKELDELISKYIVSGKLDAAVVLKKWRDRLKLSSGVI